jgi:hypothetical protein
MNPDEGCGQSGSVSASAHAWSLARCQTLGGSSDDAHDMSCPAFSMRVLVRGAWSCTSLRRAVAPTDAARASLLYSVAKSPALRKEMAVRVSGRRPSSHRGLLPRIPVRKRARGATRSELDRVIEIVNQRTEFIDVLRRDVDVQFKRIAQLQAELDLIKHDLAKIKPPGTPESRRPPSPMSP